MRLLPRAALTRNQPAELIRAFHRMLWLQRDFDAKTPRMAEQQIKIGIASHATVVSRIVGTTQLGNLATGKRG